jgi:endonuclease YncB( thermonuclease family)
MVLLCRVRRYCYAMAIAAILLATSLPPAIAQQGASRAATPSTSVFDIAQTGVEFQTGDTWSQNGQTFRLYGVQACIRGTQFTNPAGVKTDCGEASVAYFAALIRDTKPRCSAVTQAGTPPVIFTVCAAHVGQNTLDFGTILISQGFAFAAVSPTGKPFQFTYSVVEGEAQKAGRGLWVAKDLPPPHQGAGGCSKGGRAPSVIRYLSISVRSRNRWHIRARLSAGLLARISPLRPASSRSLPHHGAFQALASRWQGTAICSHIYS